MNNNLTELVYILDMSGSMRPLTADTIGGYNSMLDQQKKLGEENPALRANVTTVLFDDRYIMLHDRVDINTVPCITDREYSPRGCTAMLDAIGRTVVYIGEKLAAMPEDERPGLVSVTIITDGKENASREYTWDVVRSMIKEQKEKYSWVFTFIGANIDVNRTSSDLGIDQKMSRQFTASKRGTETVFSSITRGNLAMRRMTGSALESERNKREDALSDALNDIE